MLFWKRLHRSSDSPTTTGKTTTTPPPPTASWRPTLRLGKKEI